MPRPALGRDAASMGPQLDSCGRTDGGQEVGAAAGASMGPQLDSCGRVALKAPGLYTRVLASMEPQLDSCGRLDGAVKAP